MALLSSDSSRYRIIETSPHRFSVQEKVYGKPWWSFSVKWVTLFPLVNLQLHEAHEMLQAYIDEKNNNDKSVPAVLYFDKLGIQTITNER